ncbi:MAG: EAL domain-containing protein [Burkholderiales bacterium]|nr:EAL domain-containing protein [Burkholderiales bacterium]MDE2396596.1 EAL domain-containing protein [Burkholderiales bacterium]MDE2455959.1 EAL domain-containing protein [Burkholderiales bacterium]
MTVARVEPADEPEAGSAGPRPSAGAAAVPVNRAGRQLPSRWTACVLLVLGLIWGATFFELRHLRAQAVHEADLRTAAEAQVFAAYSRSSMRRLDAYLVDLRDDWLQAPARFGSIVRERMSHVDDLAFQVAVLDARGIMAFSSLDRGRAVKPLDLSDREHFKVHRRAGAGDRLFISDPVVGRISHKASIQFTRPILDRGRFDGVIVISVDPAQFAGFARDMHAPAGSALGVVKDTGTVEARYPDVGAQSAPSLHDRPFLGASAPATGNFVATSRLDHTPRVYGWFKASDYGLTFVVGEPMDAVLAGYAADRETLLSFAAVASSLVLALLFVLRRAHATRRKLVEETQLAAMVYQASGEAMVVTDAKGRILAVNPAFTKVTGFSAEEVIGKSPAMWKSARHDEAFYDSMWQELNTTGRWQGEIWNRRKNGEIFPEFLTITTCCDADGSNVKRIALFYDISEKKQAEDLIRHQANYDALTGLPNRSMFGERLAQEIKASRRVGKPLALMFLDLDRFKDVNDSLGHDFGDALLKEAARRLVAAVRETDTIARLGGDEFTILMPNLAGTDAVQRVVDDIHRRIAEPFHLGDELVFVTVSVGVTFYPDDADNATCLLKQADQAMFAAKTQGRNCCSYYTPALQEAAGERVRLASDLRTAIAERQFSLAYQPIVDLRSGGVHKAEALLRWRHPARGAVSPADFIPIAEETGLIIEIGNWVFEEALEQVVRWRERFDDGFQISINKSPVQFRGASRAHRSWPQRVRERGQSGECIVIELTESSLMESNTQIIEHLLAFREAGMQISLDDFGTGYSSLSYLRKFAIDYIKIDQSFVRNMSPGSEDLALCEAIIVMAHKLGMKVVAEGVETATQAELLAAAGCDYAQGYFYSRPMPAPEFEAWLAARAQAAAAPWPLQLVSVDAGDEPDGQPISELATIT